MFSESEYFEEHVSVSVCGRINVAREGFVCTSVAELNPSRGEGDLRFILISV